MTNKSIELIYTYHIRLWNKFLIGKITKDPNINIFSNILERNVFKIKIDDNNIFVAR